MNVTANTFPNRIEIDVPLPDGLEAVEGGGVVVNVGTDDEPSYVARFTWPAQQPVYKKGKPVAGKFEPIDVQACAREAVALVIASSPGDTVKPEDEQPVKTQKLTVKS